MGQRMAVTFEEGLLLFTQRHMMRVQLASCGGSMMSVTQVTELVKVVNRKNNPGNGTWVTSYGVTGALCPSALRSSEGQGPKSLSHLVGTRALCKSDGVYSQ